MSEMNVENMNTVEMTVEDNTNIPMEDPTTERIIRAVSPTVDMERIEGGMTIKITDVDGEHEETLYDGAEGPQGEQGPTGESGQDGQNAYVYIRYAANEPTQDSDMELTPDEWIGIYSGNADTAPTSYTDYTWYKIKGEQGSSGVNYASELEMSPLDSTKADAAINAKVAIQQDVQDAGKALGIGNDGRVTPVPFSGDDFTGATDSTAGVHGYVPAPAAGENAYFLKGDGTWADPPGGKLIVVDLDTVTNTSGSYTHSTTVSGITADMKATKIELGNPEAFLDEITITTSTDAITLSCNSVAGTSTVKVSLQFIATANAITSSEFDVLAGRIGNLSDLTTTAKTSAVDAINELDGDIGTLNSKIANIGSLRSARVSWGTSISATGFHQGILINGYDSPIIIWFASTAAINIRGLADTQFTKSADNSITFSPGSATGTTHTITRNGDSITITSTATTAMSIIYV